MIEAQRRSQQPQQGQAPPGLVQDIDEPGRLSATGACCYSRSKGVEVGRASSAVQAGSRNHWQSIRPRGSSCSSIAPADSSAGRGAGDASPPIRPRPRARCTDRRGRLHAGLRLPSEALALTRSDVRRGRLHVEGRSSCGEYLAGSKTGHGRDLPLRVELADEFARVGRAYREAGRPLGATDFWISAQRDGGIWSEHQAKNWRSREFRPVVRQVAVDFPQFADIARATPYAARHTFISCCLQAGVSLATIAAWCGTSTQMISATYGRIIRRYEGASPIELDEQFRAGKVEAMSLLSAVSKRSDAVEQGGSTDCFSDPATTPGGSTGGSTGHKLPRARR